MKIVEIRILPPLAIARLGSSTHPLDNYRVVVPDDDPLGFRHLVPAETLVVDEMSGAITASFEPPTLKFKDGDAVRPVAPFLEVWAIREDGSFLPLSDGLLRAEGVGPTAIAWKVTVGNIKAFRRTGNPDDGVYAETGVFSDHKVHPLTGECRNFFPNKHIPFGSVRYIVPTGEFPEIRLRFTPAAGLIYGASAKQSDDDKEDDGNIVDVVYDPNKSPKGTSWRGYIDPPFLRRPRGPLTTNPGSIYAGKTDPDDTDQQISFGYLDDECDGIVEVALTLKDGQVLSAMARIGAGPPAYAPDSFPVRTVADELEQALLGPVADPHAVRPEQAEEIVRRAFETVRLMNVAAMNGDPIDGRQDVASTMVRQDTADFGRLFEPIMASSLTDNLAIVALHKQIFAALRSGTAPWFADVLRRPDEIGDLTVIGRRKMPAMMRGADGRYLTLTRRQIDIVDKAAKGQLFGEAVAATTEHLTPANLSAQLAYQARGNPPGTMPNSAISNCFPGLEFDFRNLWTRMFVGLRMHESINYVVAAEDPKYQHLVGHRVLKVDGCPIVAKVTGPRRPNSDQHLTTFDNPSGYACMEWSNALASIVQRAGSLVDCVFTADEAPLDQPDTIPNTITVPLEVRPIFESSVVDGKPKARTAVVSADMVKPGELTQSLCSPWQNDYRECACYYWAASRPDFVNQEASTTGASVGHNWMQADRGQDTPKKYVADDRSDGIFISYQDLFRAWEKHLKFEIGGRDAE